MIYRAAQSVVAETAPLTVQACQQPFLVAVAAGVKMYSPPVPIPSKSRAHYCCVSHSKDSRHNLFPEHHVWACW